LLGQKLLPSSIVTAGFIRDIERNPKNAEILARWPQLDLPNAWLVAGCLFQTVWNLRAGRLPDSDIKDYDIFYFDNTDVSEAAERHVQTEVAGLLSDLDIQLEVANQARVHLWYQDHFDQPYEELQSAEDGIRRFLVLETCVGVRPNEIHAPYGLEGIYARTLSPNPLTPYPELFEAKIASYRRRWPDLKRASESRPA
jgi:uncharacterized protein